MIITAKFPGRFARPLLTALLIAVVPAIIETVTHSPLWDAAVVRSAAEFCMVVTAMAQAFGHGLIRVVATVIVHITLPVLRDAVIISTLEVARPAEPTGTVVDIFVRVIPAVVLRVTPPGFGDAPFVGTLPFVGLAAVMLTENLVLV